MTMGKGGSGREGRVGKWGSGREGRGGEGVKVEKNIGEKKDINDGEKLIWRYGR